MGRPSCVLRPNPSAEGQEKLPHILPTATHLSYTHLRKHRGGLYTRAAARRADASLAHRVVYFYDPLIQEEDTRLTSSLGPTRLETSIRDRHNEQECLFSF